MIDINFYMKVYNLKKEVMSGKIYDKKVLMEKVEECRSREPVIYNIETTNNCNMRCTMCPRTTRMTRPVEELGMEIFEKIADQIRPWSLEEWDRWENFVEENYSIDRNDMSENHFFLHIIPKVIVLHGYGAPLLDKYMSRRVKVLSDKNISSYFSCNPSNINVDKTIEIFKNGLDYIKFSIESVDDFIHKDIRGRASNFTNAYDKIIKLIELKEKFNYKTVVVITMLDLNRDDQQEDYNKLVDAFKDYDVYIYLKSQDQQWYQDKYDGTKSIHWTEFCQFPWSSMTVKSNGELAQCVEDFNNSHILGDARTEYLYEVWNSEKYDKFRKDHFNLNPHMKCTQQCDMKLIGDFL